MAGETFEDLPKDDELSTHSIFNLLRYINNYRDGRYASVGPSYEWRNSAAPRRFFQALLDVFNYTDDRHHLPIKNDILGCLKASSIKGMGLVKQVEKSQHFFRGGRLRDGGLELYDALNEFLKDTTIEASNRLEPTRYDALDAHLGLVPRKCSPEAVLICARFQGIKWCVNKYLTRELLLIEQDLRKQILEVLTAALLKYRHPKYPILLERTKSIQLATEKTIKIWGDRLEVAVKKAKLELSDVREVEIAQDAKAMPSPEWFVAFNAAFNEYERTLKISGMLHKTK